MITKALAANGARRVYIVGRRRDVLAESARNVNADIIVPIIGDVTSRKSLLQIVGQIESDIGFVNLVLSQTPGSWAPGHSRKPQPNPLPRSPSIGRMP